MRILTLERILKTSPCLKQREILVWEFPEGIPLTSEGLEKALTLDLDITWGRHFLTSEQLVEYENIHDLALAEYCRVTNSADTEYHRTRELAGARYLRTENQNEYADTMNQAFIKYQHVSVSANTEYRRTIGTWLIQNIKET